MTARVGRRARPRFLASVALLGTVLAGCTPANGPTSAPPAPTISPAPSAAGAVVTVRGDGVADCRSGIFGCLAWFMVDREDANWDPAPRFEPGPDDGRFPMREPTPTGVPIGSKAVESGQPLAPGEYRFAVGLSLVSDVPSDPPGPEKRVFPIIGTDWPCMEPFTVPDGATAVDVRVTFRGERPCRIRIDVE